MACLAVGSLDADGKAIIIGPQSQWIEILKSHLADDIDDHIIVPVASLLRSSPIVKLSTSGGFTFFEHSVFWSYSNRKYDNEANNETRNATPPSTNFGIKRPDERRVAERNRALLICERSREGSSLTLRARGELSDFACQHTLN